MSKPAYIYARYSSNNQKESSIDRQLQLGRQFVLERGWDLVSELRDEARSAFHGANRLAGSALFEFERMAREGHFSNGAVLVTENIDRLSRQGAKASAKLIWDLNEAGVDVATYHDGHVYQAGVENDMMDMFSIIIKGSLSQEESSKKSARSQAFWDRKHEEIASGDRTPFSTQVPAWIKVEDGKFVLDEHRAAIVRQMYEWYNAGLGSLQILYKLQDMGERPWSREKRYKDRPEWTVRYIHKVLTVRQAIGEYVTIKGETISRNYYPAVVDLVTFNQAQAIRKRRFHIGGDERKRSRNLFSGLARCSVCGKSATLIHFSTKKSGLKHFIRCNEARYRHTACDNRDSVNYEVLERTVLEYALTEIASRKTTPETTSIRERIAVIQLEKRDLDSQTANIVEAISTGVSPRVLVEKLTELEKRSAQLDSQIQNLENELLVITNQPNKVDQQEIVKGLQSSITDPDPDRRFEARAKVTAAIGQLIQRIDIEPGSTFRVWLSEQDWWQFDEKGILLEAQQSY
jgi:DNA invertase Pin-like site-specific DNA recombinase